MGREFVHPGVVHQDVETPVVRDGGVDDALRVGGLGHVAAHGDGLAASFEDFVDGLVRTGFAGGVVDDHGRPLGGEGFGDGGSDAFGSSGNDGDFSCEFAHVVFLSVGFCGFGFLT